MDLLQDRLGEAGKKPAPGAPGHPGPNRPRTNASGPAGAGAGRGGPGAGSAAPGVSKITSSIPTLPALSLPKGGGAVQGMGEKFTVNLNNGTGTLSVPIRLSGGRPGAQPQLSLSYDSAAGNSEFGLGWSLSGWQSITRKTSKGLPRYNDNGPDDHSDVFILAGAEDLVPLFKRDPLGKVITGGNGAPQIDETPMSGYMVRKYTARIVLTFSRIERWMSLSDRNDIHWRVVSPTNVTTILGSSPSSRIYDTAAAPNGPSRIFSWFVAESYDPQGNAMIYNYKREDSSNVRIALANEANRTTASRSANLYLKSIQYGNSTPNRDPTTWQATSAFNLPLDTTWKFSVVLDYGEHDLQNPKPDDKGLWACRLDPFSKYQPGFEVRKYRLCRRVLMFHHFDELGAKDFLVASTDLVYDENPNLTYLNSVQQAGYSAAGQGGVPFRSALPPTEFQYSMFPTDDELKRLVVQDVDTKSLANLPIGLDGSKYQWVDIDGEGISGILAEQDHAWYYKYNTSTINNDATPSLTESDSEKSDIVHARFDDLVVIPSQPYETTPSDALHFGDVNGAGKLDLISTARSAWGYYERDEKEPSGWAGFKPFPNFPNIATSSTSYKLIDLSGDGLPDILIYADQVYCWYPSIGSDGYGPPQMVSQPLDDVNGPPCVFADAEQTIYLADMSGDGLIDILRIRNGDCCYWPNMGYGKFGKQIRLDNAPWFDDNANFNEKRIRVADVDGSGTNDVLYLGADGVDIYLNQSGNSFADKKRLSFAPIDDQSVVSTVDLLGNGTVCIVWSSAYPSAYPAQMRYVDLFQGKKPHMITHMTNNLGSETRIQYAPSTKFYLQDKQAGNPWLTHLQFPVQCVEMMESIDQISGNRFVNRYSYHHGFFDGLEREFRGFARVDEWDSETFDAMSKVSATNVDVSWHVPPVHTITWFHTGVYIDGNNISSQLSQEYFGAPLNPKNPNSQTFYNSLLDDTLLPAECVGGIQQREACRSLKGHILRTEIYADDGSSVAHIPYSVEESNYTIVAMQPTQDGNLHGIYFPHPRESITYDYERIIEDPRIQHMMVLQVDSYGNVVKDLKISYGRLPGQSPLIGSDKANQESSLLVYSESDFTNVVDSTDYRIPVAYEARYYEIQGLQPAVGSPRLRFSDMVAGNFNVLLSLPEIQFEDDSSSTTPRKRLFKRERVLFRKDDLTGVLPSGQLQSMGLPAFVYQLDFTPGLLNTVFVRKAADGSLQSLIPSPKDILSGTGENQAGYIDLDNDGRWWRPSDHVSYSPDPAASAAQELAVARANFFFPRLFYDPFQNMSFTEYDKYNLFPVATTDAVGNVTSAVFDYRVLHPAMMTDSNGNRVAAVFDALGMVAGNASMGKASENVGDNLDGFKADLSQAEIDQLLASPVDSAPILLGNASTRIVYDLWRVKNAQSPVYTAAMARETHASELVPANGLKIQLKISYSDGFGREIQFKERTKAGTMADGGPVVNNLWVGSGWTVYNNKGQPVKQYESFFDDTHDYQYNKKVGVTPLMVYDPKGRVVSVIRPDHAIEKTVIGPWSEVFYDANDTVLTSDPRNDPDVGHFFTYIPTTDYLPSWYDARIAGQMGSDEQATAKKTASHSNTPLTSYFDALRRTILIVEDNGTEKIYTHQNLDILGNSRQTVDALNRISTMSWYSMCGQRIHFAALDSGEEWNLTDVRDQLRLKWNSRNFRFRYDHDALRRLTGTWLSDGSSAEVLTNQMLYGELAPDAPMHNLRGKVWQVQDQSGTMTNSDYDFEGNLATTSRQLAANYKDVLDLSNPVTLENEVFVRTVTYDALNRPVRSVGPDKTITYRIYNQSQRLDQTYVNIRGEQDPNSDPTTWTPMFTDIQYNPKGQTTSIRYGNGTVTTRTFDQVLFRLMRLQSKRPSGDMVQDLNYTYDPAGNIAHLRDNAQQIIYFRNTVVNPSCDFTYEPTYRVSLATGREHLGQTNGKPKSPIAPTGSDMSRVGLDNPGDGNAMGTYAESYKYDVAGNILSMVHVGSDPKNPGWTRMYSYNEPSLLEAGKFGDRLSYTKVGSLTEQYKYDGSAGLTGNITSMPSLPSMQWNFKEQLQATSKQVVTNGGTPETTYYVYDSVGERVRKVTESQSGPGSSPTANRAKERIYLHDFEVFRTYNNSGADIAIERVTVHIVDDKDRISTIETRTQGTDQGSERIIRYQLRNYLGSSCVELDQDSQLISYEEYFPFGTTSYQAVPSQTEVPKRYRFSGKELDDENGLYYIGARYYASWLGRWTATDPKLGATNPYTFSANNPIRLTDPDGQDPAQPPGGNDITPKERFRMGDPIHAIILSVLKDRLKNELHIPYEASVEEYTQKGGGKNNPGGNTRGRTDLIIPEPDLSNPGKFTAHVYDLKFDNPLLYAASQGEVKNYTGYIVPVLKDGKEISNSVVGTKLQEYEKTGLFRPLVFENDLFKIQINIKLPNGPDPSGKWDGLIVYDLEFELKPEAKVLGLGLAIYYFLKKIRQDRKNPLGPGPKPPGQPSPTPKPVPKPKPKPKEKPIPPPSPFPVPVIPVPSPQPNAQPSLKTTTPETTVTSPTPETPKSEPLVSHNTWGAIAVGAAVVGIIILAIPTEGASLSLFAFL